MPTSAGTPTPSPAPIGGTAIIVSSANSAYGGSLVLVAPDGSANFPAGGRDYIGGPDSGYSVASYQNASGTAAAPSGGWSTSGTGLLATSTAPANTIVTPSNGGTYVESTNTVPMGSVSGAQNGTLAAQGTSIAVLTYARFALACGTPAYPSAITFGAGGAVSVAPSTATADLYLDCLASTIALHFPNGGIMATQASLAGSPFPVFAQIGTSAYSNQGTQLAFSTLQRSDMPTAGTSATNVGPGFVIVIASPTAGFVKLLITDATQPDISSYLVSGGYEVHQGPPSDGF